MKETFKPKLFPALTFVYSLLVALFWTALRINYAGISKALGADTNQSFIVMYLPVLICVFLWLLCAYALFGLLYSSKTKVHSIIALVFCVIFTVISAAVVYFGAVDYLQFILPHFFRSLLVSAGLIVFALLLFYAWRSKMKAVVAIKIVIVAVAVIAAVVVGYNLRGNSFSCDAVVYAVEDEYQIVFSTGDNSVAWVEIGGEQYYDLYAGSMRSADLVHKVSVPQTVLDNAGNYTICAQQMIYRGPFGGYKGKVITKEHSFTPVNSSDGLKYYVLSDVHSTFKGAINAATKQGELDFLAILGDTVSMVESENDANATSKMASAITGGSIPVVYARGNHEIKGETAENLYKYVGSKDQKFYYTFTLGDVKGVVLDMGEDHDDDWWEYYETAQFDRYRDEQTALLQKCIDEDFFADCDYRIVLSHIPVCFVNSRLNHEPYKIEWTRLINELNVDISISGHQHDLTIFEPVEDVSDKELVYNPNYAGTDSETYGGYITEHNFYTFLAAKASNDQLSGTKSLRRSDYTGLCIEADLAEGTQTARFTNALGENVPVCSMFGTDAPAEEHQFPTKSAAEDAA